MCRVYRRCNVIDSRAATNGRSVSQKIRRSNAVEVATVRRRKVGRTLIKGRIPMGSSRVGVASGRSDSAEVYISGRGRRALAQTQMAQSQEILLCPCSCGACGARGVCGACGACGVFLSTTSGRTLGQSGPLRFRNKTRSAQPLMRLFRQTKHKGHRNLKRQRSRCKNSQDEVNAVF